MSIRVIFFGDGIGGVLRRGNTEVESHQPQMTLVMETKPECTELSSSTYLFFTSQPPLHKFIHSFLSVR